MEDIQEQLPAADLLSERRKKLYKSAISVNALITIKSPNSHEKLNANESETFTLEEYRKIILDFRMQDKDLILARVSTPDPYRQDLLYNYFYIASEVNKVLFKYESSRRLLHRMKVRNPLNNMYIIGQVQYFRITKEEIDKAIVDCFFRDIILRSAMKEDKKMMAKCNQTFDHENTLEKNSISAFSAVFRTMTSETSLVSDQTTVSASNKSTKLEHPRDKMLRKKLKRLKEQNSHETVLDIEDDTATNEYESGTSPQEILKMFDEGLLDFPVIPEKYLNRTDDLEEMENMNRTQPGEVLTTNNGQKASQSNKTEKLDKYSDHKDVEYGTRCVDFPVMLNYTAEFFATDDDFLLRNDIRDYFKKNSVDPSENFLFELDRTENDLFAILETPSSSENEEALGWKRMLTFHISLMLVLVGVVVLLGLNPIAVLITLPLALFVFISFLCSLVYVLCVRRSSFDSLAVRSVDNM
ncbi:hypothetical protein M153_2100051307 [Pseudoloma neurophilia]|uniref:Golgi protein n=1 Tax=Pseudoloma neurophilia TaxID=146866 RepID=A0A0R0M127_9MICR|nr:hypothetical protein M153_2100051307 [Pseudoloma neurophilia]